MDMMDSGSESGMPLSEAAALHGMPAVRFGLGDAGPGLSPGYGGCCPTEAPSRTRPGALAAARPLRPIRRRLAAAGAGPGLGQQPATDGPGVTEPVTHDRATSDRHSASDR